jgi:hypothetical protein
MIKSYQGMFNLIELSNNLNITFKSSCFGIFTVVPHLRPHVVMGEVVLLPHGVIGE